MMKVLRAALGSLLAVAAVVACGSSDSGGSGGSSSSDNFITQYCELLNPCCQRAGLPTDGKQCRTLYTAVAGSAEYDAAAGEQCLAAIRRTSSTADFCTTSQSPPECSKVYKDKGGGTKQPGEQCSQDADCASSAEGEVECNTHFVGSSTEKKCQLRIKGKEGDKSCLGTVTGTTTSLGFGSSEFVAKGYLCHTSEGLYCDSKTRACTKIVPIGGACAESQQCVTEAYCDFAGKKCVELGKEGADCTGSSTCAKGLGCDTAATQKCKALKKEGEACTASQECSTSNCTNGKCILSGAYSLICGT
jgi:hypothetical protein